MIDVEVNRKDGAEIIDITEMTTEERTTRLRDAPRKALVEMINTLCQQINKLVLRTDALEDQCRAASKNIEEWHVAHIEDSEEVLTPEGANAD